MASRFNRNPIQDKQLKKQMRALMDKWADLILIKHFRLITQGQQKDNKN
jgi:hypothetical protein